MRIGFIGRCASRFLGTGLAVRHGFIGFSERIAGLSVRRGFVGPGRFVGAPRVCRVLWVCRCATGLSGLVSLSVRHGFVGFSGFIGAPRV